jgi:hypothetical protein
MQAVHETHKSIKLEVMLGDLNEGRGREEGIRALQSAGMLRCEFALS